MFTGLSSLRKPEKKELTERDKQLQAYLASKYGGGDGDEQQEAAPKKKKKKKPKAAVGSAVRIVEGDVTGFAEVTEAVPRPLKREEAADDGEHSSMLALLMHVVAVARSDRILCLRSVDEEPVVANPEEAEALKLQIEKVSAATVQGAAVAVAAATHHYCACRLQVVQLLEYGCHRRLHHALPAVPQADVVLQDSKLVLHTCLLYACPAGASPFNEHSVVQILLLGHFHIVHSFAIAAVFPCCTCSQSLTSNGSCTCLLHTTTSGPAAVQELLPSGR
jgi:hypothetical protein